ncbi:hypothetical protein JCM3766R1_001572 [Sporobolomyces carnicolor]
MLSSLPTELLAQIIESAVPHTFHSRTYFERQRTLRNLSLVCSRFRAIAQPLLDDIAWFPTTRSLELAAANERLRCTVAVCGSMDSHWLGGTTRFGQETLSMAHSLTLYRRSFQIGFEWPPVAFLSHLRCLQLYEIYYDIPDNLVLPHIESLCLGGLNFRSTMLERLLDSTALPALRHFALGDEAAASSVRTRIEGILPQLETITLDLDVWSALTPDSRKLAIGRTLVDCSVEQLTWAFPARIPVVHLRMYDMIDLSTAALKAFVDLLTSKPLLELQSIYLDCPLLTIVTAIPGIERLREVCAQRKVEIVFERMPANYLVDWFISPEFVRRQKMAVRGDLSKRGGTHKA